MSFQILFIAFPITEHLQTLAHMQDYFSREIPKNFQLRLSQAQDVHVTVAYLGKTSDQQCAKTLDVIADVATKYRLLRKPAYLLWDGNFELFNNALALTFAYDEGLALFAGMVRDALYEADIVFDDRYPFRAHATIGRIKPSIELKKRSVRIGVLDFLKKEHSYHMQPMLVQKIGIYSSSEGTIPVATFSCT